MGNGKWTMQLTMNSGDWRGKKLNYKHFMKTSLINMLIQKTRKNQEDGYTKINNKIDQEISFC